MTNLGSRLKTGVTNPWGKPRVLPAVTLLYILWSLIPVGIAVLFSFNSGRSRSTWQGFSTRWYVGTPEAAESVLYDESLRFALTQSVRLAILTMLVATPIGVALALGLARWRGRGARASNLLMLIPLVTPEIVMGVALFLVFDEVYDFVPFGTWTQFLGHVTFSISFVVIMVRGRLFAIGRDYEEAAMDLGASPFQAMRRVLLPLLAPALLASLAIVFAISIDDFVISQFLIGGPESVTIPVQLYSGARLAPPPSLNALATILMVVTIGAIALAGLVFRALGKRRGEGGSALESVAGFEM
jgi:spermidine/putrescine transport system permease protein